MDQVEEQEALISFYRQKKPIYLVRRNSSFNRLSTALLNTHKEKRLSNQLSNKTPLTPWSALWVLSLLSTAPYLPQSLCSSPPLKTTRHRASILTSTSKTSKRFPNSQFNLSSGTTRTRWAASRKASRSRCRPFRTPLLSSTSRAPRCSSSTSWVRSASRTSLGF